jgi:stalled ribosome rescue protein Dom34
MKSTDIVVWLNNEQAHLYSFQDGEVELVIDNLSKEGIESTSDFHSQMLFHNFFHQIFDSLKHADRVLLVGPGSTKTHLIRHALKHELDIEHKIVGIETLQSPELNQIHELAESYFK